MCKTSYLVRDCELSFDISLKKCCQKFSVPVCTLAFGCSCHNLLNKNNKNIAVQKGVKSRDSFCVVHVAIQSTSDHKFYKWKLVSNKTVRDLPKLSQSRNFVAVLWTQRYR